MPRDLLGAALGYATVGWRVFPCQPGGKRPLGALAPHGCLDAITDEATIRLWWSRCPGANVAIATGAPGPCVVDFDTKAGAPGETSFLRLRTAGLLAGAFGVVQTPSGGWHLYFEGDEQPNGSIITAGVDYRGRNGYVLAPPSRVNTDSYSGEYLLIEHRPRTGVRVDWPAIRRHLQPPAPARPPRKQRSSGHDALVAWMAARPEGGRNNSLFWAACKALETGAETDLLDDLTAAAVKAGLSEREATATVASAVRHAAGGTR